jgi:putative transposase
MEKYKNKYRIPSVRLQGFDYSQNGVYFITICTQNREHHFGEIKNGKMVLSPCGVLADVFLYDISHRNPGVELRAFVVMPNHIHVLLILNREKPSPSQAVTATVHAAHPKHEKSAQMSAISPKAGSISVIIGAYKSAVTKYANRLELLNGWQPRFHDHIVRNEEEYERIYNYIENNPLNWEKDKFNAINNPPASAYHGRSNNA